MADPDGPRQVGALDGFDSEAYAAAFSADGHLRLWPTDEQALTAHICATAGDPITEEEWATFVPGRAYEPPCEVPTP